MLPVFLNKLKYLFCLFKLFYYRLFHFNKNFPIFEMNKVFRTLSYHVLSYLKPIKLCIPQNDLNFKVFPEVFEFL